MDLADPHAHTRERVAGVVGPSAQLGVLLIHGRGGSAEDLLSLLPSLRLQTAAFLAPEAQGHSWYPQRFLAPLASNEPWLGSALLRIARGVARFRSQGLPSERIALIGFSQGACLALEYVARNPARYACVAALSGALLSPEGPDFPDTQSLANTPVLLGCSLEDPHIPADRVRASARQLTAIGAAVTLRLHPVPGHSPQPEEISWIRDTLRPLDSGLG